MCSVQFQQMGRSVAMVVRVAMVEQPQTAVLMLATTALSAPSLPVPVAVVVPVVVRAVVSTSTLLVSPQSQVL
jgi:hypothetical protein